METLFTPAEAAEYFGIKVGTCWKWLREGYLKGIRVGRSYAIPESEILRLDEAGARHSGKPSKKQSFFIRVNGKPVKIIDKKEIPDVYEERAAMWREFFLEHSELRKKAPGQTTEPEIIVTGLPDKYKDEFNEFAAEAVQDEELPQNIGEENQKNDS